jgi:hypothetical protein
MARSDGWGRRRWTLATVALAAVLCLPAAGPAAAHPKRKPGLWEVRSAGVEAFGMPATRFCVGERTDSAVSHLDRSSGSRGSCSLGEFVRSGDAWVAESVCREGRSTVTSRAVASGDFETEYRIDTLVVHAATGSATRREDREAVVARFLGPCGADQRPGDLVVPGMGTLNMNDGTFRAEPPPRGRRTTAAPSPARPTPSAVGASPSAGPGPASSSR